MRLGSAKDVKMLFSHFAAALAFRCILLIQDAARQCPFLHFRAVACAFLSRPPVETQNLASPDWHGFLHCRAFARAFLSHPPVETQNLASPVQPVIP